MMTNITFFFICYYTQLKKSVINIIEYQQTKQLLLCLICKCTICASKSERIGITDTPTSKSLCETHISPKTIHLKQDETMKGKKHSCTYTHITSLQATLVFMTRHKLLMIKTSFLSSYFTLHISSPFPLQKLLMIKTSFLSSCFTLHISSPSLLQFSPMLSHFCSLKCIILLFSLILVRFLLLFCHDSTNKIAITFQVITPFLFYSL